MSSKRPLGPPSGNTPHKPPQKSRRSQRGETTSRKSLLFNQDVTTKTVFTVFFENLSTKQGIFKPCAPYVSQILFTRMFLECLWHSNKLIEIRYTKDR